MKINIISLKEIQMLLKITFGIVPIVAGLDKFLNILTVWTDYLSPVLVNIIPFSPAVFMMIVGVIEIAAGILVFYKTEFGAYLVSAWLVLIALSLLTYLKFLDVAVRDIVMAIGAYSLGKITAILNRASSAG